MAISELLKLKMPKVKAYENGELEIIPDHANGWVRRFPRQDARPSMTTVFWNPDYQVELVVMCSTLMPGELVFMNLVPALSEMLHTEAYIVDRDDDSASGEDVSFAYTVNRGFADLVAAYNETPVDYSQCE